MLMICESAIVQSSDVVESGVLAHWVGTGRWVLVVVTATDASVVGFGWRSVRDGGSAVLEGALVLVEGSWLQLSVRNVDWLA